MKKILSFTLLGSLIFLVGCEDLSKVKIDDLIEAKPTSPDSSGGGVDESVIFSGISTATNKSDSAVTLNWVIHARAVAYDIFSVTNGDLNYLTTIVGGNVNSVRLTGLTPSQTYHFRVRVKTSAGLYDGNENDHVVVMDAKPAAPSALSFISPYSSPGLSTTPQIRVSGVKSGDTVRLFRDSNCSTAVSLPTLSEGVTVDVSVSGLSLGNIYTLYARSIGQTSNASDCSSANLTYVLNGCPTGYIPVEKNLSVGTNADFCVAKYEMKNVSEVATSQAALTPWVSINQDDSLTRCAALNAINGVVNKFALISNPEWMTIARNVEQVDENWAPWYGAIPQKGVGVMARGHTDGDPASILAASADDSLEYTGTGNTPTDDGYYWAWSQKRTLKLSNGSVIWDLSGNAMEWVDWKIAYDKKAFRLADGPTTNSVEWKNLDTKIGENSDDVLLPATWASSFINFNAGLPDVGTSLDSSYGIGSYVSNDPGVGDGVTRGSSRYGWTSGGVFSMNLVDSTGLYSEIGFRCVYRP